MFYVFYVFYVIRYVCYKIYMYVNVYCKTLMLYKTIQNLSNKENFDTFASTLVRSINGSWQLISQIARTKASLICIVRPQQLCSGAMHIKLASKLYSHGNRSIKLRYNVKRFSWSGMALHHVIARQLETMVWWRDIHCIKFNFLLHVMRRVNIYCSVSMCLSGGLIHSKISNLLFMKKNNLKFNPFLNNYG